MTILAVNAQDLAACRVDFSLGLHLNYSPKGFGAWFWGIGIGRQQVEDEGWTTAMAGQRWSYVVSESPLETGYFVTPKLGVRWLDAGYFSLASEIGWFNPFAVVRKYRFRSNSVGTDGDRLSKSDHQWLRRLHKDGIKTTATLYVVAFKSVYRL